MGRRSDRRRSREARAVRADRPDLELGFRAFGAGEGRGGGWVGIEFGCWVSS